MDAHAQKEIRQFAVVIGEQIVSKWVPMVWEAFLDYQFNDLHLSRIEREILVALVGGSPERARSIADSNGLLRLNKDGGLIRNRERDELEAKLSGIGLAIPW